VDTLRQDLRQALRSLRGAPRLTLAALGCMALGIGSALFIVTLAHAILLQRLPFPDAQRLVRIWTVQRGTTLRGGLSHLDASDIREQAASFDAVEWTARTRAAVATAEGTERVRGESVTPGYFGLIGIRPVLGRLFTEEEYAPAAAPVIVLGDALWKRKYGGRADILGQSVRLRSSFSNDAERLHTVVGVMPPGFAGTVDEDVSEFWLPIEQYTPYRILENRDSRSAWAIARIANGSSLHGAQRELIGISLRLAEAHPDSYLNLELRTEPIGENWRERLRPGLLMLLGAAMLLLVIACTNIAHLLLARLISRRTELTVRMALGAGRGRILRQLLTESLVLALAGGLMGATLASASVRLFVSRQVIQLPAYVRITPDWRVLIFAIVLVLATCLLFGALPAWLGARADVGRLRDAGRGSGGGRRQRVLGDALVGGEIALTFLLLSAATLMLRSYTNLLRTDPGYRTENLARLAVSLDAAAFPDAQAMFGFVRDAKQQLASQPGVAGVSFMAGVLPPWFDADVHLALDGVPSAALSSVQHHSIDADFLGVMDIALLHGRALHATDDVDAPRVALVSETLARAIAGGDGSGALVRPVQLVRDAARRELTEPIEVVGIVEDVRYHGPLTARTADHDLYVPIEQAPDRVFSIAVQTSTDAALLIPQLQRELGRLAPTSPQHWTSTMENELKLQFGSARLHAWLTVVFGGSALLLAVLGVYGVLAHTVSRRRGELGIRMAVGAQPLDIVRLVLGQASRPLLLGITSGAALAFVSGRFLGALVYDLTPTDPATFALVGVSLLGLGLLASWLPVRRAVRVEPVVVLRGE
jgi:predicted permease